MDMVEEVSVVLKDRATGETVKTRLISLCVMEAFEVPVGDYILEAIYTVTGETLRKEILNLLDGEIRLAEFKFGVVEMGTVTFSGAVSVQAAEGETVTITVTKPDGTKEQVTALTQADLTYNVDYTAPAGPYLAKARIEEDAQYSAAESDEVAFTIGKTPRTITLNVTPKK